MLALTASCFPGLSFCLFEAGIISLLVVVRGIHFPLTCPVFFLHLGQFFGKGYVGNAHL